MNVAELIALREARKFAASGAGRAIREATGLSLHELADAIGVSASTLLRWERGEHRPRGASAIRYADVLHRLTEQHGQAERSLGSEAADDSVLRSARSDVKARGVPDSTGAQ